MSAPSAMLWSVLALCQGMPALDVDDPGACLDRDAVAREVVLRLPVTWAGPEARPLSVGLVVAPSQLVLTLVAEQPREELLARTITVNPGDCAELPTLIAVIVARRLEALPAQSWVRAPPASPPLARPPPPTRAAALSGGLEWGLERRQLAARLALDALMGPAGGFALALGTAGTVARPEPLGPGAVRFSTWTASVGVARPLPAGPATFIPALLLSGGLVVAAGRELADDRRGIAPTLRLGLLAALHTPEGVRVELGLLWGLVRARARDDASATARPEPLLRATLGLGFVLGRKKP